MKKDLIKIANRLDSLGLNKEADLIDSVIRKMSMKEEYPPGEYPTIVITNINTRQSITISKDTLLEKYNDNPYYFAAKYAGWTNPDDVVISNTVDFSNVVMTPKDYLSNPKYYKEYPQEE